MAFGSTPRRLFSAALERLDLVKVVVLLDIVEVDKEQREKM
jgi:hypothetical protein